MRFSPWPLFAVAGATACTSVLGIDGDYVVAEVSSSTGGASAGTGGASAGGGATGTGGGSTGGVSTGTTGGTAGSTGGVGAGGQLTCGSGEKACDINSTPTCVTPDPSVGCDLVGCIPCSWPANGYAVCTSGACDFACQNGYTKNAGARTCDPSGTGGGTGSGGCTSDADCTNGNGPTCPGFTPCCAPITHQCGCKYVAWCQ